MIWPVLLSNGFWVSMNKISRLLRYDWPLYLVLFLTNWLPDNVIFLRLRGFLIRPFLKECGSNLRAGRNVTFNNPSGIHLGKNVFIAYGCWFAAAGSIHIGDEVMFGPYIVITAGNHARWEGSFRYGDDEILHIFIGRGSWVGAHATILGGVKIGKGSMVASGASVVRGEYPDNSLLAGVPAIVKKTIEDNPR